MLIKTALVVGVVIPPLEVLPPRSPYEFRWWEEEEAVKEAIFDEADREATFRLLIEEVMRDYESTPWPRQEP